MKYIDYIADPARACAVIAHRGAWHTAPENSLLAIEKAILAGHEVVEIDIRRSADGEFFLLHDDTLERMTGLDQVPETLTLQQLTSLTLRDRDGRANNRMTDEKLPSLKQVFELTRGRIFIDLDIKHVEMLPEVIACARSMGVEGEVDFKADLRTRDDLAWIRGAVEPYGVPFMAKTHLETTDAETQTDLLFQLSPFMCEIYFDRLEQLAERKSRFREAGIALWVNTLDPVACAGFTDTAALKDPEAIWGSLIDAGVSAIQTDEPQALKTYLDNRRA
ncbi:MAG: glycerophosphodiester phosphodiesterase family protein [Rhizobiaceae bacterium]|nr:glycerophosphodiester phosphodiesterase family protein [Rhizobiaceae bacterium]